MPIRPQFHLKKKIFTDKPMVLPALATPRAGMEHLLLKWRPTIVWQLFNSSERGV
jgi:hypothetical protein